MMKCDHKRVAHSEKTLKIVAHFHNSAPQYGFSLHQLFALSGQN